MGLLPRSGCPRIEEILVTGRWQTAPSKQYETCIHNKRLTVKDQGLTGTVEMYSLTVWRSKYGLQKMRASSITRQRVELWTRAGHIKLNWNAASISRVRTLIVSIFYKKKSHYSCCSCSYLLTRLFVESVLIPSTAFSTRYQLLL